MTALRWTILTTLVGWPCPPGYGQPTAAPKPPVTPHERLTAQGYTAVPLVRGDTPDTCFVVPATTGKERLRLLLDTGAEFSTLQEPVAKRARLKPVPESGTTMRALYGDHPVHARVLTDFALGTHKLDDGEILVGDLWKHPADKVSGTPQPDGLLGQPTLHDHAAVIDCGRECLYLSDARGIDWAFLRGEWVCVKGERDGKPLADPRKWSLVLSDSTGEKERGVRKAVLRHEEKKDATECRFQHVRASGRKVFAIISKSETDDSPLFEQLVAAGQFFVEGGRLKFCFTLPEAGAKERISPGVPTRYGSAAGSRCATLEFERVGKAPDRPDPLSEVLARLGYQELPLVRVGNNGYAFAATVGVGKHRLRMLIDTGAPMTILDIRTVERLELQPRPVSGLAGVKLPDADKGQMATVPALRISSLDLPDMNVPVWDLSALATGNPDKKEDKRIDGLLGNDLLSHL